MQTNGTISGAGSIDLLATGNAWQDGTWTGGSINVLNEADLNISGSASKIWNSRTLNIDTGATANFTGRQDVSGSEINTIDNSGTLNLISNSGDSSTNALYSGLNKPLILDNNAGGEINKTGDGNYILGNSSSLNSLTLNNAGALNVNGGTLTLSSTMLLITIVVNWS